MANDFVPLLRSIWSDDDWRALTVDDLVYASGLGAAFVTRLINEAG